MIIGSTDVKALYPSLDIEFTVQIVYEVFETSGVTIDGVDYEEVWLYISLNRTAEEIQALGLDAVCPTRARQEALRIGLKVVMNNHTYKFNGCIRKQQKGGPIGLELTGNLAQVFMIWWDRTMITRLSDLGIVKRLCKRYVDDVNYALIV